MSKLKINIKSNIKNAQMKESTIQRAAILQQTLIVSDGVISNLQEQSIGHQHD